MTAKTGGGKTAAAMRLAAHVATGRPIGSIEVEKGTVIYAAGENPTDVQARWLGVTQEMWIDPETVDVHFINGVVKISENVANIEAEVVAKALQPTLVIVDTVAANFEGDDDNDNVQMGNYARLLRSITNLPGGPCVLALAHPTKRAADDDLIPKGGGAFLNEVDGNVALRRNGQVIAFEALGKFRGPSFEPVHFELVTVQHPKLRDTKGRAIPTVVARPVSDVGIVERERANERDEDALLKAIDQHPRKSRRDVGKLLGMSDSRVYRLAQKLEQQKLIRTERSGWTLTGAGERELNAMDSRGSGVNQPPLPPVRFPGAN
ncbi:AAA family ATPase [Bradyrhizobium japonicum]|nr:AAA family ATPase [Bradyrhizobium japonicum]